jgi:hypothetical protein
VVVFGAIARRSGKLRREGCAKIFREKATGAQADRRQLLRLLKGLTPGDVVTVTRIDRLARSTFDLFAIVKQIVDTGGRFRSLAEPWADTATSTGRLMIAVLGGPADVDRDLIRTRTAEGRSRCMKSRCSCLSRARTAISADFATFGNARQASAIVLPPDAANIHSSSNTMNFRSGRKRSPKAPPFGSMTASVAGSSRKLSIYRWSSLMLICEKLVAMIGAP